MTSVTATDKIGEAWLYPNPLFYVDVGSMPAGFEDWVAEWNTVNDGYVKVALDDHLVHAIPALEPWVAEFRQRYPDQTSILVHVGY